MQSGYFQLDRIEMQALHAHFFKQRIYGFQGKGFPALFVIVNLNVKDD